MTVSSTTVKNSYSGNGSTTQFAYGYKIFADSDLIVIIRTDSTGVETVKTLTTHYTVSGAGDASGSAGGNSVYNDGTISLTAKGGAGGVSESDKVAPDVARAPDTEANTVSNHTPTLNIGTNPAESGVIMESSGQSNRGSGGKGGNSFFGYGGRGGKAVQTSTGEYSGGTAVGFGAGGGGSATRGPVSGGSYPAGNGAGGLVIIYEYS